MQWQTVKHKINDEKLKTKCLQDKERALLKENNELKELVNFLLQSKQILPNL